MKKLTNTLKVMAIVFALGTLTSANTPQPVKEMPEEDDLRCVIRNKEGVKLGACWFCDCAELAKQLVP